MNRPCTRLTLVTFVAVGLALTSFAAESGISLDKQKDSEIAQLHTLKSLYLASTPRPFQQVQPFPEAGTCSVTPMSCNTTVSGSLGVGDCTLDSDGTYLDIWTFSGTAGQTVTITMRSTAFDSYLALGDPNGDIAAEDNNSGGGQDARISFTLTSSGTWGVIANQWSIATGSYSLSLECETGGDCTPQVRQTSCGLTVSGTVDTSDCSAEGFYTEFWTLTASAGQSFTVAATRTSGTSGIGVLVFHDDGTLLDGVMPDGSTATVTGTLPEGGTWVIAVFSRGRINYSLSTACQSQATCTPTNDNLCLNGKRFRVIVAARDPRTGKTGTGRAVPYNDLNGFFSLPALTGDSANFEVFVKILDGRPINGKFWVFYGGLTDFEYTVTVTDSVSGLTRRYTKPGLQYGGGADTGAF